MAQVLRTPEARFEGLDDYPFAPHYFSFRDVRMHYVDEGQGEPVLLLHGEPTWSYLYRKVIQELSKTHRVIAPDLIGFGKSDKYASRETYSYQLHYDAVMALIEHLEISNICLGVHDWGGLIGLGVLGHKPEYFSKIMIMNTFLPTGDKPLPFAFKAWRAFARWVPGLPVGFILQLGTYPPFRSLPKRLRKAYQAPFPSGAYKAGAKGFPALVPAHPHDEGVVAMNRAIEVLRNWYRPVLIVFGREDPIMMPAFKWFVRLLPDTPQKQSHLIRQAGHFLQEDQPDVLLEKMKAWLNA